MSTAKSIPVVELQNELVRIRSSSFYDWKYLVSLVVTQSYGLTMHSTQDFSKYKDICESICNLSKDDAKTLKGYFDLTEMCLESVPK